MIDAFQKQNENLKSSEAAPTPFKKKSGGQKVSLKDKAKNKIKQMGKQKVDQFASDNIAGYKETKAVVDKTKATVKTTKNIVKGVQKTTALVTKGVTFIVSNPIGWVVGGLGLMTLVSIGSSMNTPLPTSYIPVTQVATRVGCNVDIPKDIEEATDKAATANANAIKIHAVMKKFGLSEYHIAGMLGNFSTESGNNSVKFESDYLSKLDNKYNKADVEGPTAEALFGSWENFKSHYDKSGISLNRAGYQHPYGSGNGPHYIGIGLGQWTGSGAFHLWQYAKHHNKSMFDIDLQVQYMVTNTPGSYYDRLVKYRDMKFSNVREAADAFMKYWEINEAHLGSEERYKNAAIWYSRMSVFTSDDAYANTILSQAGTTGMDANNSLVGNGCQPARTGVQAQNLGYLMDVPYRVGYGYGKYTPTDIAHFGVDIWAPEGTDLFAVQSGTIVYAKDDPNGAGGTMTTIKMDNGQGYLIYMHLVEGSASHLRVGQRVKVGDNVGKLGNTGTASTGAHLHFEYRKDWAKGGSLENSPNPWIWLKGVTSADQIDGTKYDLSKNDPIVKITPQK